MSIVTKEEGKQPWANAVRKWSSECVKFLACLDEIVEIMLATFRTPDQMLRQELAIKCKQNRK